MERTRPHRVKQERTVAGPTGPDLTKLIQNQIGPKQITDQTKDLLIMWIWIIQIDFCADFSELIRTQKFKLGKHILSVGTV